ncbi:hypothetical protein [Oryza sativa Japonica Group]|uniref:Uncharacterized protein n=1 Tax=Oryza sativa subsp. japonica TaxID=39947 RepID=Q8S033_ORYSJ|nr:hypothetical protein [Oryza sativa Japonica Group]
MSGDETELPLLGEDEGKEEKPLVSVEPVLAGIREGKGETTASVGIGARGRHRLLRRERKHVPTLTASAAATALVPPTTGAEGGIFLCGNEGRRKHRRRVRRSAWRRRPRSARALCGARRGGGTTSPAAYRALFRRSLSPPTTLSLPPSRIVMPPLPQPHQSPFTRLPLVPSDSRSSTMSPMAKCIMQLMWPCPDAGKKSTCAATVAAKFISSRR